MGATIDLIAAIAGPLPAQIIADNLPLGVWVARAPGGEFVYANRAFAEIMGMSPDPSAQAGGYAAPYGIFDRTGQLYPEERMPFARALEARARVVIDDIVIHRRDGRHVYIRAFAQPLFEGEAITHVVVAFTDMTDEVVATRARETSEAHLANLLAQAPLVLFACERDGTISVSRGSGLDRMGLRDLVGKNAFEVFPDHPEYAARIRRALAGDTFTEFDTVGTGWFETTFAPQRDEQGDVVRVIGVSYDVTERTEMQRRLVLVERLAAMGTLAASVAHEINSPLTYVLANLGALSERLQRIDDPAAAGARALVADVRDGAERVRRIVRDLQVFARDDEHIEPTDATTVLERAVALADSELCNRVRIIRDYRPVPLVAANETRLAQVFVNLLVNAAHATAALPGVAEVHLRAREDDAQQVVIEIADNGPGIAPELRAQIFEPFFTTKRAGGTGLGLSISQRIVQRFGGTLAVDSEVGRGSTFCVRLPVAAP